MTKIWRRSVNLLTIVLLLGSLAAARYGRLLGSGESSMTQPSTSSHDTLTIYTAELDGQPIIGYNGEVPLEITIIDNRISSVEALDNDETPGFFHRVVHSGLLRKWDGMTTEEAAESEIDAVSGATYSSTAVIQGVRRAAQSVSSAQIENAAPAVGGFTAKTVAAIVVITLAMTLPLMLRGRALKIGSLVIRLLNVGVLGMWAGVFLDYAVMLNIFGNGLNLQALGAMIATVMMLVAALIYPLIGRSGYYCWHVCPLGSAQDLASQLGGKLGFKRLNPGAKTIKWLQSIRYGLWLVLMVGLWTGLWTAWIDNELFVGMVINSGAPTIIVSLTVAVIVISLFVPRPFCRFVCPTGTILRLNLWNIK